MLTYLQEMSSTILYIAEVVIAFGVLVTVHELGHFLVAKASGMRIDEFAIGFGKSIISFQKGETLYSIRLIPLGGYNRIYGEGLEDETEDGEEVPEEEKMRAFNRQPLHKRAAVILAGSFMNLLLAIILVFIIRSIWGVGIYQISGVNPNGPGYLAGMREGDLIETVQGEKVGGMMVQQLIQRAAETYGGVRVVVERDNELVAFTLNPVGLRDSDRRFSDLGFVYFSNGLVERVDPPDDHGAESTAWKLGLRSGDYLRDMKDGKVQERFTIVGGEYYLSLDIRRYGSSLTLSLPKEEVLRVLLNYTGLGFFYDKEWNVVSIDKYSSLTMTSSNATLRGMKIGDIILSVDGKSIDQFVFGSDDPFESFGESGISLTILRDGKEIQKQFHPAEERRLLGVNLAPSAQPLVLGIEESSRAFKAGLRNGDEIIAVGSEPAKGGIGVIQDLSFVYELLQEENKAKLLYDPERLSDVERDIWEVGDVIEILTPAETATESEIMAREPPSYNPYFSHIEPLVTLKVLRNGTPMDILVDLTPPDDPVFVLDHLGFTFEAETRSVGFFAAWKSGFSEMGYWIRNIFYMFKLLFSGGAKLKELMGPVGIMTISYKSAQSGIEDLMNLLVLLTVNLAVINLLPLPALDGGRVVFLLLELVVRKPVVNIYVENIIHLAGLALLLLLIIYITVFDLQRVIEWF